MSIEFACPACGDLIRTPEGTAGKQGQCPLCHHIFTIPRRSFAPTALPVRVGPDGKLEFSCFGCGQLVRVPTSAGGKRGQCPHCSVVVQIPDAPTVELSPSIPATLDGDDVEFDCPKCREAVRTPLHAVGKRGMCPHCQTTFVIPKPQTDAPRSSELPFEITVPPAKNKVHRQSERKQKPVTTIADASGEQVEFDCPTCSRRFRISASLAGKKGRCPKCQTSILIPSLNKQSTFARAQPQSQTPSTKQQQEVDELTALTMPTSSSTRLTPLDSKRGLTPIDSTAELVPIEVTDGLIPVDDSDGLIPIDDTSGLIPIESSPALKPIKQSPAVTPLNTTPGLTPITENPTGLTLLEPVGAKPILGEVDDGRSLIPLRNQSGSSANAWTGSRWMGGDMAVMHPTRVQPVSSGAFTFVFIGLLVVGIIQTTLSLIAACVVLPVSVGLAMLYGAFMMIGILQIFGAFLLRQRRGYGWCIAACISALFSCLGLPVGIVGLITLAKHRESFTSGPD